MHVCLCVCLFFLYLVELIKRCLFTIQIIVEKIQAASITVQPSENCEVQNPVILPKIIFFSASNFCSIPIPTPTCPGASLPCPILVNIVFMYNIIQKNNIKSSLVFFIIQPFQLMRKGYLTHTRTARSQSNLHIYIVLPVSLNTKLETKESVRQRARYLDSLDSFEMADFFLHILLF